jgi:hypothetical protein
MRRFGIIVVFAISAAYCTLAQSPLDQIWNKIKTQGAPSNASDLSTDKITAGLKEALKVSTSRAVAATGKPDGFLKNPSIKIQLPDKLRSAGTGLRLVGMGPQLDQLEVGMNRAAEQAAPKAKQIFLNALTSMTITDARNILKGSDTAATEFFRSKSSAELTTAFTPIVHTAMQNVGVVRQYNQIMQNSMAAPLLQNKNFDLDNYVVGKTLDGLFFMLGEEEKKIRRDPAAQTTDLLREVFGTTHYEGGVNKK